MARYKRIESIGSGGFGTVFRARRRLDNLEVAMKVLDRTAYNVDVARFEREVRSQRSLNHPNIVHIIGQNLKANSPWYAMELADCSLRDILSGGAMSEEDTIDTFRQILAGVSHAHENGVIHRDLKPENVLIFRNKGANAAKIGDFGIARNEPHDTATLTGTSEHLGTLGYVAPEQWHSPHKADNRSDIYALGILLHEILSGEQPVPGMSVDVNRVDAKFQYIVQKCIEGKPEERFQSVEELRQQFELAIRPSEMLDAPADTVRSILEAYRSAGSTTQTELLSELTRTFETNVSDYELYSEYVPRLPDYIVSDLIEQLPNSFARIIENFDGHVSGSLTFSYTDVVADFYESLFRFTDSLHLKRIILARLLAMGVSHNRWHVMNVTVELFEAIDEVPVAQIAAEVITSDTYHADSLRDRLLRRSLHQIVRDALEDLD